MEWISDSKPVNVSSVPQRSPFRYPGGKTWFVPTARRWFASLDRKPRILIDAFAGGGIIGLTAAFEDLAEKVILVECDHGVAAVWRTILGRNANWLVDQILSFDMNVDNVRHVLDAPARSVRQRAFNTILKNRTFHGGIMAAGASLIKKGENGKGIGSRWYPETLAKRILAIHAIRDRIEFVEGDGISVLELYANRPRIACFVDPPYTASKKRAGSRLYNHSELDHEKLFAVLNEFHGEFLMTYDNDDAVLELVSRHQFDSICVAMRSRRLNTMLELMIAKNVDFERSPAQESRQLVFGSEC